jgi:hypothetical protein
MLHVTNGSVFLSRLHDLGVQGQILPWDDVLHEGPVPEGLAPDALRRVRAEFLAISWGDVAGIEHSLAIRDRTLLEAASADEIVLWFEHDLYDQLHVLQVVDFLQSIRPGQGASPGARVSAILAGDYLAAQPDERLREWFDRRQPLGVESWAAAEAAWRAFRSPDPRALCAFDHPGAWPALAPSLRRHLQQYPSARTGLSRTEHQTLAAVSAGPLPAIDAFRAANHAVEDAIFMGDEGWWWHIRPLLASAHPLLRVEGEAPSSFNDPGWWSDDQTAPRLVLTETGGRVLAGELDHVRLNGLDRWLGGVHLRCGPSPDGSRPPATGRGARAPEVVWRWNEARGTLERG